MFNPLGAGFRWAVEIPHTGPATRCSFSAPDSAASRASSRRAPPAPTRSSSPAWRATRTSWRWRGSSARTTPSTSRTKTRARGCASSPTAAAPTSWSRSRRMPPSRSPRRSTTPPLGGRIVLAGVKGFKAVPDFVSDLDRRQGDHHQRRLRRDVARLQRRRSA